MSRTFLLANKFGKCYLYVMEKGTYKRITGLWKRGQRKRGNKEKWKYLKSGLLNHEAIENMQYFGEKTLFLIMRNLSPRGVNPPDFYLLAVKDQGIRKPKEVFWEDLKERLKKERSS